MNVKSTTLLVAAVLTLALVGTPRIASAEGPYYIGPAMLATNQIDCNFNGTSIPSGRTIWFNSIIKPQFTSSQPVTILFRNQIISFTASATLYTLSVPDAAVTFDPGASSATTTFDTVNNVWVTHVPTGLPGNEFLSGLGFASPGLPGGIQPVSWSGDFYADSPSVAFQWTWAAAVYTSFSSDNNALGVKPCDSNSASIYLNSDHAGTPESFKGSVVGGARGGGGSNYTGSLCSTQSVPAPTPARQGTWGSLKTIYR